MDNDSVGQDRTILLKQELRQMRGLVARLILASGGEVKLGAPLLHLSDHDLLIERRDDFFTGDVIYTAEVKK
jgi:hypothetical protein